MNLQQIKILSELATIALPKEHIYIDDFRVWVQFPFSRLKYLFNASFNFYATGICDGFFHENLALTPQKSDFDWLQCAAAPSDLFSSGQMFVHGSRYLSDMFSAINPPNPYWVYCSIIKHLKVNK